VRVTCSTGIVFHVLALTCLCPLGYGLGKERHELSHSRTLKETERRQILCRGKLHSRLRVISQDGDGKESHVRGDDVVAEQLPATDEPSSNRNLKFPPSTCLESCPCCVMPYTRPDRKGLPESSQDDEDEIPRSESYLRLSDLGNASNTSLPSESPSRPSRKDTTGSKPALTPPEESDLEQSPSEPRTPPEKADMSSSPEAKSSSRKSPSPIKSVPSSSMPGSYVHSASVHSPARSPSPPVHAEVLTASPERKTDSVGRSRRISASMGSPTSSVLVVLCHD
jgi:hypothetical protein